MFYYSSLLHNIVTTCPIVVSFEYNSQTHAVIQPLTYQPRSSVHSKLTQRHSTEIIQSRQVLFKETKVRR